MKFNVEILPQKGLDLAGLVVGQIVDNDVNLLPWFITGDDLVSEVTVQRLSRGLLIYLKHGRVLRQSQIQSDHIGDLGLEFRLRPWPAFQKMWAHIGLRPSPLSGFLADLRLRRQFPARPMRSHPSFRP